MATKKILTDLHIDGNVGIGTTSPNFSLDVNGDIRIEDTHKFFLGGSGGTADWFTQATGTGLNFAENGVADYRLFLKNGGNVGIGTNNPGYKLDVSGNIRTNSNLYIYNSDLSKQTLRVHSEATTNTGILKLSNGSNWGLLMKGVGNGPYIGSYHSGSFNITGFEDSNGTSPSAINLAQFSFGGSGGSNGYLKLNGDLKVNNNKKIQFGYSNSQTNGIEWYHSTKVSASIIPVDTANFARTGLGFFTGDYSDGTTNADERMRITRVGNVGIGTTSPLKKLSVSGGDIAVNNDNGFIVGAAITGNTEIGRLSASSGQLQILTESTRDIKFASTTYGNIMFLEGTNGNVGIGTDSPVVLGGHSGMLTLYGSNATALVLKDVVSEGHLRFDDSDFKFTNSGGDVRMQIETDTGNVGIGTDTPGAKLEVNGNILATGTVLGSNLSGTNTGDQDLSGYAVGTVSDAESNSTIVKRNASGYIFTSYYNGSGTFSTTNAGGTMGMFTGTNGTDTYGRSYNAAQARILLNVEDGATGDQDLSGYLLNTTDTLNGALTVTSNISAQNDLIVSGNIYSTGAITTSSNNSLTISANGTGVVNILKDTNITGNVTGSNLSGTNTGDQDLSSFLTSSSTQSKYLRSDADDVTNSNLGLNQDKKITFDSNSDGFNYIRTISATDGYRPAGVMVYGSVGGHHFIDGEDGAYDNVFASGFKKDGGTASQFLKADGSVDSNTYVSGDEYRKYYQIDYTEHIALSDESTALTTGTSKVTFRSLGNIKASMFRLSCNTAPTGSVITVDINVDGVSILSTKLTIDAGEKTSRTAANAMQFATGLDAISDDAEITVDIDGVGSTIAGAGLKLIMYYNHSVLIP